MVCGGWEGRRVDSPPAWISLRSNLTGKAEEEKVPEPVRVMFCTVWESAHSTKSAYEIMTSIFCFPTKVLIRSERSSEDFRNFCCPLNSPL